MTGLHRQALAAVLLLALAGLSGAGVGCATTSSRPGVRGRVDVAAVTLEPLRYDEGEAFAYLDGRTGRALGWADVAARARAAELIVVGEQHDQPSHHDLQRRIVESVAVKGAIVGLEMVTWPGQAALDRYAQGAIDVDALARELDWQKSWGHDFAMYRPILVAAHAAGAGLRALNAPRDLVHAVAVKGLQGLTPEQRALLPELDLGDDGHRRQLQEMFGGEPKHDAGFERFYTAQVVWDESMADGAARALIAGAPVVVVLAGNGHVLGGHGIPQRALRRRPGTRLLTVVPVPLEDGASAEAAAREAVARGDGDVLAVPRQTETLSL